MKISENKYVEINYTLTVEGEVVDKSEPGDPLGFISGTGQIVSGLDNAIQGKEVGDTIDVSFSAEDGYGPVEKSLFQDLPRDNFPVDLKIEPDMVFQAETPHGTMSFRIAEVKENSVVADLNHPLAGKALSFNVVVRGVRDATAEELESSCGEHECTGCGCH
jgi:FKBP-type peptidyl-prolyl cis-trans isomerase SlyD